jgi:transcriptional regulator with XRE-family HTH domain
MSQPKKPASKVAAAAPDAVAFLDDLFGHEADWQPLVERARANQDVAHALYDLRTAHGLTQQQLAERVGTKQAVIARLEDANYEGHSLRMLTRIAAALEQRVKVEFVPLRATTTRQAAVTRQVRPQGTTPARKGTAQRVAASQAAPPRKTAERDAKTSRAAARASHPARSR